MKRNFYLFLFAIAFYGTASSFNKVIIWGHKLHTHTHSYIHHAFFRAFTHLGYATYWFDDNDHPHHFDYSKSLFITEGQADKNIPVRNDCSYVLHNCTATKYESLLKHGRAMILQVYTHDVKEKKTAQEIAPCIYTDTAEKTIYMPWASNLLPPEIEELQKRLALQEKSGYALWVGSIWGGQFGNEKEIKAFRNACKNKKIPFIHRQKVDEAQHQALISKAMIAPALVGSWQNKKGYIPCRIFKNISYGAMGITNSEAVYELFQRKIIYHQDSEMLLSLALEKAAHQKIEDQLELMEFIKKNHTYLQRIELMLAFLQTMKDLYGKK